MWSALWLFSLLLCGAYSAQVSPVEFTPQEAVFINRVDVVLSCSTRNATIHYETNDFLELTESSPIYQSPLSLTCHGAEWSCSTTIRAQAFDGSGQLEPSAVTEHTYSIVIESTLPSARVNWTIFERMERGVVTMATSVTGGIIQFSLHGEAVEYNNPTMYTYQSPVILPAGSYQLQVQVFKVVKGVVLESKTDSYPLVILPLAPAPILSPRGGLSIGQVEVSISLSPTNEIPHGAIYFAVDEQEYYAYTEPITLVQQAGLPVKNYSVAAFTEGTASGSSLRSNTSLVFYQVQSQLASPSVAPSTDDEVYQSVVVDVRCSYASESLTVSWEGDWALILRQRLNGTDSWEQWQLSLNATTPQLAAGVFLCHRDGYASSEPRHVEYLLLPFRIPSAPSIYPPGGEEYQTNELVVSFACSEPHCMVEYTTDGSDPTTSQTVYNSLQRPLTLIPGTHTVRAVSHVPDNLEYAGYSSIQEAHYIIYGLLAPAEFQPPSGTQSNVSMVVTIEARPLNVLIEWAWQAEHGERGSYQPYDAHEGVVLDQSGTLYARVSKNYFQSVENAATYRVITSPSHSCTPSVSGTSSPSRSLSSSARLVASSSTNNQVPRTNSFNAYWVFLLMLPGVLFVAYVVWLIRVCCRKK